MDRLFSTLEPCDVSGFKRKPTNLLSAASLIAGTAVGAGILALPAATLQAGLLPSAVGLVMMWAYMVGTALLIAEVNVNVICSQGTPGVGLIALAEQALGKGGARFTGLVYVFIHYSLLVAYMAQGGELLAESFNSVFATAGSGIAALPEWASPVAFCLALGGLVLFFTEEFVASVNSVLVGVVLLSFFGLVGVGSGGVQMNYLAEQDWSKLPSTVPVLFIAMVFHNVIPVVTTQLEGDVDKIRKAVIGVSLAPLLMFIAWNGVILGSVSKDAGLVAEAAGGVFDPLQALRANAGSAEGAGALIGPLISIFSEVAIITSFIGFIVGLLDFFTDVLKIPPGDTSKELPLYGAILLPPLGVAVTDPDIFFAALDTAGTFGISLLCGVLPAAMAWRQRYSGDSTIATLPLVPGGKATLAGIAGFAGVVIFQKLLEMAGLTVPA
ncbi:Tyrosine Transport protein [Ectocarpus siliculosus]|uniref:Tyrosine Transport protein n=1 Tax=Ectocarpus siliculosus TaxID=2880 RepID=D7FNA9_ECTSI|nr:Tyrosine Transport protein [Ectocarpus siliculosus]|eukprot:CBJ30166.1 Tyrosine Transport protein [Ectocarpus siliculosus]